MLPYKVIIRNIKYVAVIQDGAYRGEEFEITRPVLKLCYGDYAFERQTPLHEPRTIIDNNTNITWMRYYYYEASRDVI